VKNFLDMFDATESKTSRIFGENGTAMLTTTGNRLLDVFGGTTRFDLTKASSEDISAYIAKIDACIASINSNDVTKALFCALGFYLRDIKEKGERTLFHIFFCRLWKYDAELAKALMGFIVGAHRSGSAASDSDSESEAADSKDEAKAADPEYFGSWKDLHQILELAINRVELEFTVGEVRDLFRTILQFEGIQLEADWKSFIDAAKGSDVRAKVSLCAKWLVSAGKRFDRLRYIHEDKELTYHAAFCAVNATALVRMCEYARTSGVAAYAGWSKTKESNFLGLQKVLRKVKSALNDYMGTPEQDMCAGTWSEIEPSGIPARNMTKHRRAFHNEKSAKERKSTQYSMYDHPFGDRHSISNAAVERALEELQAKVGTPEFAATLTEFKASLTEFGLDEVDAKVIDRVLCRFRVMHCVAAGTKKIHGARSDINDLVTAALRVHNASTALLASDISSWAGKYPERALLHRQADDKLREISESIVKAVAESLAALSADLDPKAKAELESKVRINLKRTIGLYDVSGSMESGNGTVRPIDVCLGLSYFITRLSAPVGITFHERPRMFKINPDWDFAYSIHHVKGQEWGGSTDFQAAYRLILEYAKANNLSQDQIPDSIFVISDMQVDAADRRASYSETMFETMEREFGAAGYKLPLLVFWNVNGQYKGQSVGADQKGVITISGFDPAIMKTVAECGALGSIDVKTGKTVAASPIETMVASLTRPRYMPIIMTVLEHCASVSAGHDDSEVASQIRSMYAVDHSSSSMASASSRY